MGRAYVSMAVSSCALFRRPGRLFYNLQQRGSGPIGFSALLLPYIC